MKINFLSFIKKKKKIIYFRAIAKKSLSKIRNLIIIVKRLQNSPINSETKNLSINDIDDILKMIDSHIYTLKILSDKKIANKRQLYLQELICNLYKIMKEFKVKSNKEAFLTQNFYNLFERSNLFITLLKS